MYITLSLMSDDDIRVQDRPVDVDAGLGEHQEPEIHVERGAVEGGQGVVDQHAAVREP